MAQSETADADHYHVTQPTGHGRPEDVVVTIDDKVVHYTDFVGVEKNSRVHQDVLAYETRNVYNQSVFDELDTEEDE